MPIPERLLDRSRGWITLPGVELYLELQNYRGDLPPAMSWALIDKMGDVQQQVRKRLKDATAEVSNPGAVADVKLTPEEQEIRWEYRKAVVASTVKKARWSDGETIELNMMPSETGWLSNDEFEMVYLYADGLKPLPGKDGGGTDATEQTSNGSPDGASRTTDSPGLEPATGSTSTPPPSSPEPVSS